MDLRKTQFLFGQYGVRTFRRRSVTVLVDKTGKVRRKISHREFRELVNAYPQEAAEDGLGIRIVWELVEVTE